MIMNIKKGPNIYNLINAFRGDVVLGGGLIRQGLPSAAVDRDAEDAP